MDNDNVEYVYDFINRQYIFGCSCTDKQCRYCFAINNIGCSDYMVVPKSDYDEVEKRKVDSWAKWDLNNTL